MSPIYPLLPQRSATLNCHMPPSTPFSIKVQHESTVICPPPPSSPSKIITTQLSYVPSLSLLPKRSLSPNCSYAHSTPFSFKSQHHSTVLCRTSTPFSLKCQHHSTVFCPPPPSQSKVSTTQVSYVPIRPIPPQWSAPLNCHRSPSTAFYLKCQHHSTVVCLHLPLLNQRSAPLNCRMSPSTPFSIKDQHHSTVLCPLLSPSLTKVSITQLSYAPLYLLLNQRSATLNFHMSPLRPLLPQRSA